MPGMKSYDVVVAGAGIAGCAAAVAAARQGMRIAQTTITAILS